MAAAEWRSSVVGSLVHHVSAPSEKIRRSLHHSNPMQLLKLSNLLSNKKQYGSIVLSKFKLVYLNDVKQIWLMEGS